MAGDWTRLGGGRLHRALWLTNTAVSATPIPQELALSSIEGGWRKNWRSAQRALRFHRAGRDEGHVIVFFHRLLGGRCRIHAGAGVVITARGVTVEDPAVFLVGIVPFTWAGVEVRNMWGSSSRGDFSPRGQKSRRGPKLSRAARTPHHHQASRLTRPPLETAMPPQLQPQLDRHHPPPFFARSFGAASRWARALARARTAS